PRYVAIDWIWLNLEAREVLCFATTGSGLQHKPDLKHRVVTERAFRLQCFNNLRKRHLLVVQSIARCPGHPLHDFAESRVTRKARFQDECVDEIADQIFCPG